MATLWKNRLRRNAPLFAVLTFDAACGAAITHTVPFQSPNIDFWVAGTEFGRTLHVNSDFLPIGFSAVAGLGYRFAHGQTGMSIVAVMFSLLLIASAWIFLRTISISVRTTIALCVLLSIYPDVLFGMNKVMDTTVTAALLFIFISALIVIVRTARFGWLDVGLALVLAYSVLVRPNLVVLFPVGWFVFWKSAVPFAFKRALWQFLIAIGFYCLVTTAVHGRPFVPQNGPYNFCAGANEYTEGPITSAYPNLEDSIGPLVMHQGFTVAAASGGTYSDVRDTRLNTFYFRTAVDFIRTHPGRMLRYTALKLYNLLRPDFRMHAPWSAGGAIKIVEALGPLLWLAAFIRMPHPGPDGSRSIIALTLTAYIVPFLLTISAQRFGVPLQIVCWVDLAAMVAFRFSLYREPMASLRMVRSAGSMSPRGVASAPGVPSAK